MKWISICGLVAGAALAQESAEGLKGPDLGEMGPKIVAEAFGRLSAALGEAIAKDGVPGALLACSEKAPSIAVEVGRRHGVIVRRAAIRARNPLNKADAGERVVLGEFAARLGKKETPKALTIRGEDGSSSFLAPIVLGNPLCLQCHGMPGKDIAPATLEAIRKLYPDDEATGFRMGDLRGLWSVKLEGAKERGAH